MNLKERWDHYLSHDAPPFVQFIKYGMAGGAATVIHILVFFLAGFLLFPCVSADDPLMRFLSWAFGASAPVVNEVLRGRNAAVSNVIAFVIANAVCYVMNRLFVFRPGRHHVILEFLLFFAVSAISAGIGTALIYILVDRFGVQTSYAFIANIFSSLAINYLMRKFFVFKG
jgi:putative flippase GtrA